MLFEQFIFRVRQQLAVAGAAVALGAAHGCAHSQGDPAPACDGPGQAITYAGVISPIFDRHCRDCHSSSAAGSLGGGQDLGNYQTLFRYPNAALLGSIEHTAGYVPMPKGRPKVSDCDIARIKAWMAAGKPDN